MSEKNKIDTDKLNKPLDSSLVLSRKMGGREVQYLEGHQAIRHANRIFGFDGWSYEVSNLILTDCGTQLKKKYKDNDPDVNLFVTGAQAVVKVTVGDVAREDVGFGSGLDRSKPDSHEAAGKEAVTDGLKRALRSFGDQFGNGLYDKRLNHTWNPDPEDDMLAKIADCKTSDELKKLHSKIPADEKHIYNAQVTARLAEIKK